MKFLNYPECRYEIASLTSGAILATVVHVYSRGLTTTTQWGDTILSLSESCLLSNPVGKTTKTSSSKQVILQMHSICFSFKDMTSVKNLSDEVKAADNLLFPPAVAKNGFVF